MEQLDRQQARQWLEKLAAALEPWRLVIVSGNHLFAGVMVWTYPGEMRRASSLADLQGLLGGKGSGEPASPGAIAAPTAPAATAAAVPAIARRPIPQQLLPLGSDAPGCLDPEVVLLFFLLCDDLPDGELEQALALLYPLPPERWRVLAIVADHNDRQRLQRLQARGLDGLCTLGSCCQGRIYTALEAIASGAIYIDPLFRQRLQDPSADDRVRATAQLTEAERRLLREVCRGYINHEIACRHGLADNSVRRYLSHSYQRLGVRDRAQTIGWCVAHNLIPLEELQRHYCFMA